MEPVIDAPTPTQMSGAAPVVETFDLGKFYRTGFWMNEKIESLKNCTLTVSEGETFGPSSNVFPAAIAFSPNNNKLDK